MANAVTLGVPPCLMHTLVRNSHMTGDEERMHEQILINRGGVQMFLMHSSVHFSFVSPRGADCTG